jgi:hypothetical protein
MKHLATLLLFACSLLAHGGGGGERDVVRIYIDFPVLKLADRNEYFMLKIEGRPNTVYSVEFSFDVNMWLWLAYVKTDDKGEWLSPLVTNRGNTAFFRVEANEGKGSE